MRRSRSTAALLVAAAFLMVPALGNAAGEDPVLVGEDVAGDAAVDPTTAPLGTDAVALYIHRPDLAKPELKFIFKVTELNATPPGEVIRYRWDFKIGARQFRLQAKTSDVVSTTLPDDPVGQLTHVNGAFRLRGDCQLVGTTSSCRHLRWVTGEFDVDNDQVEIIVPIDDPVAPEITAGAIIEPVASGVDVGFQAVLSFSGLTTDLIEQLEMYTIPSAA